ncbi:hypothetical protein OG216_19445 [Streptomycetaceae bacterium NBC_01309]
MSANTPTTAREFIIVGREDQAGFTLWDIAPAPTDPTKRSIALEELGVEAMDSLGWVTTKTGRTAREALNKLLAELGRSYRRADYGLTADSRTENLDAEPFPQVLPERCHHDRMLNTAHLSGYQAVTHGPGHHIAARVASGTPHFSVQGAAVLHMNEMRDRVRAAVINSGFDWPHDFIEVQITPCTMMGEPEGGMPDLDLAIACAVLGAAGHIRPDVLTQLALIGSLGLDGRLRPGRGVINAVDSLYRAGHRQIVIPEPDAREAAGKSCVSLFHARDLRQLADGLNAG